ASRRIASRGVGARHRVGARRGVFRLPDRDRGLAGRLLRARGLRPVPALRDGNGQPRPHPARARGRPGPRQGPERRGRGGRLHVRPRLLRARPDGGGGALRVPGPLPRRRAGAHGRRPLPARGSAAGRSLRPGIARARGHRGRPVSTVFFLYLLHLSVGLLAALVFVPERAGDRFFKLCAAVSATMLAAGSWLLYRRYGTAGEGGALSASTYRTVLALALVSLLFTVVYNRAWHF